MALLGKDHGISKLTGSTPVRIGGMLILIGFILLAEQRLRTGWLALAVPILVGLSLVVAGLFSRRLGLAVAGSLMCGVGAGGFLSFYTFLEVDMRSRVGFFLVAFGMGWLLIPLLSSLVGRLIAWWALTPAGIFIAAGAAVLYSGLTVVDFTLYILIGLALALLVWGFAESLFGLIIPGSLLMGIAPGIYLAWGRVSEQNSLARTGIMLVCFALGWGLITIFSRRVTQRFVWWPLIPGGVLAMVGWGLYIGGNPDNALSFIGNTGSIGLILVGIYLILLRSGIRQ